MVKKAARIISNLSTPWILSPAIIFLLSRSAPGSFGKNKLFLLLLGGVFLPAILFYLYSLSTDRISDWEISKRKERYPLYLLIFAAFLIVLGYIFFIGHQTLFIYLLKFVSVFFLFFVINLITKISGHAFINSLLSVLVCEYFFADSWQFLLLGSVWVFLVAASRIVLQAHTFLQVLLGALLPFVLALL